LRIIFFGTAEFAVPTLVRLVESGHQVKPVVTAPAKPQGRGRRLVPSPVETAAQTLGLEVLTPADPNAIDFIEQLSPDQPDVGVLVAYGAILKPPLLNLPKAGFINLHPSLLPAYRGAAPIPRALMAGEKTTGVTVIAMTPAVDAGDILNQERVAIEPDETAGELAARLAPIGAELVLTTLEQLEQGHLVRHAQNPARASRAPKITKEERPIDWSKPAVVIHNQIRALSPDPAATTTFRQKQLLILRSHILNSRSADPPGTILLDLPGLAIATGQGVLELLMVKPEGGTTQTGRDFRNGHRPKPKEMVGTP